MRTQRVVIEMVFAEKECVNEFPEKVVEKLRAEVAKITDGLQRNAIDLNIGVEFKVI